MPLCHYESTSKTQNKLTTAARRIQFNKRRFCAPINIYANHSATFQLVISGDIETNPGPTIRVACPICQKTVRKNSYHLECKVCLNSTHVKCIHRTVKNFTDKHSLWTCTNCLLTELPFNNANIDCYLPPDAAEVNDVPEPTNVLDHLNILNANRDHFSICHLNIQSIKSKTAQLETMLLRNQFDILTISETWLVENPGLLKQISFSGYAPFKYNNRTGHRGGGVGAYFKDGLKHKARVDIEKKEPNIEHQWFEVKGKKSPFLLAVFYQPSSDDAVKREWLQKFETLISYVLTIWTDPIVITGDTNIDVLKQDYNVAHEYKETLDRLGLRQHITKPTRRGKTCIDHIVTTFPKVIHEGVIPCDEMSDHDAVYIICNMRKPRFEPRFKYIRNEKNFNANLFKAEIEQLPFNLVYAFDSPEEKLDIFNELFASCLNRHVPLVKQKVTRPPAPWLKELNINDKQKERDYLRMKAHTSQSEEDWNLFRNVRNELKKLIRVAKSNFYRRALSSKRPKEVWSTIHRILKPSPQKINADPETLNKHFNTTAERLLNSKPKSENLLHQLIERLPEPENPFTIAEVSYGDVRKAILSLRNDCSTGHDQLPSKYLKLCVDEICSPVCHIINTSIIKCVFPSQWKISKISPIPKIDYPAEPSDYRPISILPILSKVYEKLIMTQMTDKEELLSVTQSGFRKGHCTVTTCIKIKNDILKAMNRGEVTLAVLADFSKAFDTVDFEILLKKLHSLGFSRKSMFILSNYLSHRYQYVQIDDNRSSVLEVTNGVPQGSILGPILFNIYVHDMATKTTAKCVQYADDTSIYRHTKPMAFEICSNEINSDINEIEIWSHDSNLIFNATKTKSMLFATKQMARRHDFDFKIKSNDGKLIERVPTFKLLGVTFSEDMTWNNHVKNISAKAYGTFKSLTLLKRYLPYKLRKQLAETLILSKLDYGNAIINNAPTYLFNQLQKVQNSAASFVRKSYSRCPEVIDLKWLPIKERVEFSIAKLAWKSINKSDWPRFLPMEKDEQIRQRPSRHEMIGGTKIRQTSNIGASFEFEASNIFNDLPMACRNSLNYKEFCKQTKNYFIDKALARSLQ